MKKDSYPKMPNNYFYVAAEPKKGIPSWIGLLIIIIISIVAGIGIISYQSYVQVENSGLFKAENSSVDFSVLNKNDLLSKLFPELKFENETAKLSKEQNDLGLKLSLKDSKEDYFVSPSEKSLLLIAELEGMPHVAGLYHAYLGLFDKNGKLLTPSSSFPSADSNVAIGDSGNKNDYIPENDKPHFGADNGFFGFNSCKGIKYITFVASDCPNSTCCFDAAVVYKINNGKFEVIQKVQQKSYDVNYGLKMTLTGDELVIKKVPDHLDNIINDCVETDYKVLKWNKETCNFEETGQTSSTASWKTYQNSEYGFSIAFPDSWKGYTIKKDSWNGWSIDENSTDRYSGVMVILKNPQSTAKQAWQDIPIMVIDPNTWQLIEEERVVVSAAPIGPAKLGENSKYIFATPPRWCGFTDAIGCEEADNIVKTFKAF